MIRLCVVVLSLLAWLPAGAQTLRMGMSAPVTSLDPHVSNAAPNSAIAMRLYDRLVRSGEGSLGGQPLSQANP